MSQHLSGVPADRRPRVWIDLQRADRRDSDATAAVDGAFAVAAVRVVVVRRVLRGVSGENQYSGDPGAPQAADCGSRRRAAGRATGDEGGCFRHVQRRSHGGSTQADPDRAIAVRAGGTDSQSSRHAGPLDQYARPERHSARILPRMVGAPEMKTPRQEILERIRIAKGAADAPRSADYVALERPYRQHGNLDAGERLKLFTERLIDYDAGVYRCAP